MLVDADVGVGDAPNYWTDDHAACVDGEDPSAPLRMAYVFEEKGGTDDVTSFFGVMLLDRPIHAYRAWSGGDQDPHGDVDRYLFLRGSADDVQTIDPPTTRPLEYRFLISTVS